MTNIAYSVLEEYNSIESLDAVLLDNTPLNTGFSGGLCACLENKLGRKLHLIGCFLHINELPLRHLIRDLDGGTVSGNKLSGPIGRLLDDDQLYRMDPVQFEPVPCTFERPVPDLADLSDDQRMLLEYTVGISCGKVDEKFIKRKPGPLNHSRWLTTATRILILYTRTQDPSEILKILVTFIVTSYAPAWFLIKRTNNFTAGPAVFFKIIQGVKEVEQKVAAFITHMEEQQETISEKVFRVLGRNAFCCLGENFLTSLLYSPIEIHRQVPI
jgi:hypothetical protein